MAALTSVTMKVDGDKKLAALLEKLPKRARGRVLRGAVTKAMRPVTRAIQRAASVHTDTGTLAKSIAMKRVSYGYGSVVVAIIGPKAGSKRRVDTITTRKGSKPVFRNPAITAHLLEGGTRAHTVTKGDLAAPKKKGAEPKQTLKQTRVWISKDRRWITMTLHPGTRPTHFMENAWRAAEAGVLSRYRTALRIGIENEARKLK